MFDDSVLDALVAASLAGVVSFACLLPLVVTPYLALRRRK